MANTSILAAFERMWQHVLALVGNKANIDHTHETANGGVALGTEASASMGGAIGKGATVGNGGAVGSNASTSVGGAVGMGATSGWGGAVGWGTSATRGFSGGEGAKATVDAIQLGYGTNTEEKSLQVYSKQLMNGDGYIPFTRLISHSETITGFLESGTSNYVHNITKTWTGGIPIVRSVNWTNGSSTYAASNIIFSIADDDFAKQLRIRVQRPTGVSTSTDVNYCLQIDILGI